MTKETNEAQVVTADAQFSIAFTMRPRQDYVSIYEGQPADDPVYFFPEGDPVDPLAEQGESGYAPNLARGLKIPMGSHIMLLMPNLFWSDLADPPVTRGYIYTLIWRIRNLSDFLRGRLPFHSPRDQGVVDTTAPPGSQSRVPIIAAYQTITYVQPEPGTVPGRVTQNVHSEDLQFASDLILNPRLPGGSRQPVQQGIADPATVTDTEQPGFMIHDVQAFGDDLLIAVRRLSTVAGFENWAFGSTDLRFRDFLGAVNGVQVFTGTSP